MCVDLMGNIVMCDSIVHLGSPYADLNFDMDIDPVHCDLPKK